MSRTTRLALVLGAASIALLVLAAALLQFGEIERPLADALRHAAPAVVKETLRPFRAPQVLDFAPAFHAQDIAPTSPITVTFLTPMNRETTQRAVGLSPRMEGTFRWVDDRTLVFTPRAALPLSTTVTVKVSREARSWLYRRADADFAWNFTTVAPPAVVASEPAQGAQFTYLLDRLALEFNRAMEHASVEARLRITPPIYNQHIQWLNNQLLIGGALKPSTQYTIAILSGARDAAYGLPTQQDFVWTFTTTQQYPYFAIVNIGRYGVVAADKPTAFKTQFVNVSRIDAQLYPLDLDTYLQTLAFSYDSWRNFKPRGAPLKTWSIDPQPALDKFTTRDLNLDPLPAGLYYLIAATPEQVFDAQVLVATKTALTLKRTPAAVLVWATNLDDGKPATDLALDFYDAQGNKIGAGKTDAQGLYEGKIDCTPATTATTHYRAPLQAPCLEALHLIGYSARGGDFAAVSDNWQSGIEPWRWDAVQWQWNVQKHTHRVDIATDRPVYRPGQTVFFKALVRRDDDGDYAPLAPGAVVHVKFVDAQNRTLSEKELTASPFGAIADHFPLSPAAGLGAYRLFVAIGDEQYEYSIQVEEYRPPDYTVRVQLDQAAYVNGDTITATIAANYRFGDTVQNAQVLWTLFAQDYAFTWGGGEMDFGARPTNARAQTGYEREVASGAGRLNARGEFTFTLPVNIATAETSQVYTLQATVMDAAQEPQSATARALVHRGAFYVGAKPSTYLAVKGKAARFDLQTVDTAGQVSGHVALSYTLDHSAWDCHTERDDTGRRLYRCDEIRTVLQSGNLTTDAQGKYRLAFTPPRGGAYRLEARGSDARGNRVLARAWLWVSAPDEFVGWELENNDRLDLKTDKNQYRVGETARVLIQSPYPRATALVTIERGKILAQRRVALASNSAVIEIPIQENYFPNVYVSAVLVPENGFGDKPPSFKIGYAELPVVSNAPQLNVRVTVAKKTYKPSEKATLALKTTDAKGKAVSAEVSLAVLDKETLTLEGAWMPDAVKGFYGRRDLAVKTAQSLTVFLARVNVREDIGGGGGGEQDPRRILPQVAYWNPLVVTDANGNARVEFQLPDALTTWVAIANAATAQTQVGRGVADIVVTQDIVVRPLAPRFLRVGDRAAIGAVIQNHTARDQGLDIAIAAPTLQLPAAITHTTTVRAGQALRMTWNITAPTTVELGQGSIATRAPSATVTIRARGMNVVDAAQVSIPLEPFGAQVIAVDGGVVEKQSDLKIVVPPEATFASLTLTTAPSLAAGLIDARDYLEAYTSSSVEQTTSRVLAQVLVSRASGQARNGQAGKQAIRQQGAEGVEDGLTRLYALQHDDGGWGWWERDASQPYMTAYVVEGLVEAQQSGFKVDENVIQRARAYLKTPLRDSDDYDLKTYLAYVLTEAGGGDLALARALMQHQDAMGLGTRAYLALMLHARGDDDSARELVSALAEQVNATLTEAHWREDKEFAKEEYWVSAGRTTALLLRALLAVDEDNPLIVKSVRYLLHARRGGYWRTPYETAQVVGALAEYLTQAGESEADFEYHVFVDGARISDGEVSRDTVAQPERITLSLPPGEHSLRVSIDGAGQVYYASRLSYYLAAPTSGAQQALAAVIVRREYLDPRTGAALKSFRVGDVVQVRLTVEAPRALWYVMVGDPLPAGFEAVQASLRMGGMRPGDVSADAHWELRDERVAVFAPRLSQGAHTFTYLVRATTSGEFRVPPAEAVALYEPEVFGHSASASIVIQE